MARRRGRKRKIVDRQPNGQPARSKPQHREDVLSIALEARQRVFGVGSETARAMPETTFLVRLFATGEVSQRQYDAAVQYEEIRRAFVQLHPTRGYPEAGNLDRGGGFDASDGSEPDYVRRFNRVSDQERACRQALYDADKDDARASHAVEHVVMQRFAQPHLVVPLRIGLNALANALNIPLPTRTIDSLRLTG